MTRDEADRAANEAAGLIAAVIRVAKELDLTPEQTGKAVVDMLMACPKTPHWFETRVVVMLTAASNGARRAFAMAL